MSRISIELFLSALVDGIALGFIFLMLSLGLSIIFGLMRIVNFAHGSLFTLGAYIGYEVASRTNNIFYGSFASLTLTGLIGLLIERFLLKIRREPLVQVIITVGLMILLDRLAWLRWGDVTYIWSPQWLEGAIYAGPIILYKYRLFLIISGIFLSTAIYYLFTKTRYGLFVRAGIDDREMIQAFGVNIERIFTTTFVIGSMLAGVAGFLLVPWQGVYPLIGTNYLLYAFAIIVIGGIGSIEGTIVASIVVGIVQQLCAYYAPYLSEVSIFAVMLSILLVRPRGVLGKVVI
ncbi:MAG: branched-chain amino acid ABC transporter permease [Desulfurococcales archaeon]|nr:branched-chain amino acid ABC transporter permease [Desulfurococcales archaeon]